MGKRSFWFFSNRSFSNDDHHDRVRLFAALAIVCCLVSPGLLAVLPTGYDSASSKKDQVDTPDPVLLKMKYATFDPLEATPEIPRDLRLSEPNGVYIVQFRGPVLEQWYDALAELDVTIHDYLPDYSYIIEADAEAIQDVEDLRCVRWIGPMHPAYKIAPGLLETLDHDDDDMNEVSLKISVFEAGQNIGEKMLAGLEARSLPQQTLEMLQNPMKERLDPNAPLKRLPNDLSVPVVEYENGMKHPYDAAGRSQLNDRLRNNDAYDHFKSTMRPEARLDLDANLALLMDRIEALGGRVTGIEHLALRAVLPARMVRDIASRSETSWIQPYQTPEPYMDLITDYTGAQRAVTNYGYNGSGVVLAYADTGIDRDHPEFEGKIVANLYDNQNNGDIRGHGTCVAGILAAKGANPSYPGMAPGSDLVVQEIELVGGEPTPAWQGIYQAVQDAKSYGARVHSNSYGATGDNTYGADAADVDSAVIDHDVLVFMASGNTGQNDMGDKEVAKNAVTVGGMSDQGTTSLSDDAWAGSSGTYGPAEDGRLKPDLVASTSSITTADIQGGPGTAQGGPGGYSNGDYTDDDFGGTSAASPIVAGASGPIVEAYRDGYFENYDSDGEPSAALLKAILIADAEQLPVTTADDRHKTGWGQVNLDNVFDIGVNHFMLDENQVSSLSTGETSQTWKVSATGQSALKIALVWSDPAAAASASPALVNDLDLTVTDGTNTYKGNYGLMDGQYSQTGGTKDSLNNVESVFVQSPTAGTTYEISVNAANAPSGQDFALVVSGVAAGTGKPFFNDSNYYGFVRERSTTIGVIDSLPDDPDTAPLDPNAPDVIPANRVKVTSTVDTQGVFVELVETGNDTKIFTGDIRISYTTHNATTLKVKEYETRYEELTIEYQDLYPTQQTLTVSAYFDDVPPDVHDVKFMDIGRQTFSLRWAADEMIVNDVALKKAGDPHYYILPWYYRDYFFPGYVLDTFSDHGYYGFGMKEGYEFILPDTDYQLYILSWDMAGNLQIEDNNGQDYHFHTAPAQDEEILYIQDGSLLEFVPEALKTVDLAFDYHSSWVAENWSQNLRDANSSIWGENTEYDLVIWDAGGVFTETINSTPWGESGMSDQEMIDDYIDNGNGNLFYIAMDGGFDAWTDNSTQNPNDEGGDATAFKLWYQQRFLTTFQHDSAVQQPQHPSFTQQSPFTLVNGTGPTGGGTDAHDITGGSAIQDYWIDQDGQEGVDSTQVGQGDLAFNGTDDLDVSQWIGIIADAMRIADTLPLYPTGQSGSSPSDLSSIQFEEGVGGTSYDVAKDETVELNEWSLTGVPNTGAQTLTLTARYRTSGAYTADDTIEYYDGSSWQDTGLQLTASATYTEDSVELPETFSRSEIGTLQIRVANTQTGIAQPVVEFDYMRLSIAVDEQMSDVVYTYDMQDSSLGNAIQSTAVNGHTVQMYQDWFYAYAIWPMLMSGTFMELQQYELICNITNWMVGTNYHFDADRFITTPTAGISGQITDEFGTPMQGIYVSCYDASDPTVRYGATTSNATGYYVLDNLDPSVSYIVQASFRRDYGYVATNYSSQVSVSSDTIATGKDIALPSTAISGVVTDRDTGAPIADATIQTNEAGGFFPVYLTYDELRTDASGAYHVTGIVEGNYDIVCKAEGYKTVKKRNVGYHPDIDLNGIDFSLRPKTGTAPILFVDDDAVGATTHNWNEVIVLPQLDQAGIAYDTYTVPNVDANGPAARTMNDYKLVIWSCGWQYTDGDTLTETDRAELANYLDDSGGLDTQNLLLIGSDVIYGIDQLPEATFSSGDFMYDYMAVEAVLQDYGIPTPMEGVPGTWADGINYETGTDDGDYTDQINTVASGGTGAIYGLDGAGTFSALHKDTTDYKSIFFAADFAYFYYLEDILDCLQRMINWFEVTPPTSPGNLTARIAANGDDVVLQWEESFGTVDQYNVYRGTSADFEPNATNKISPDGLTATTYTDIGAASDLDTYYYIVRAENSIGEDERSYMVVKTAQQLSAGWNLISTPITLMNTSIESYLAPIEEDLDVAWHYDETREEIWKWYEASNPFSSLEEVSNADALWVRMDADAVFPMIGETHTSIAIALHEGWNFVGYPSFLSSDIGTALDPIAGTYDSVYLYNETDIADHWKIYDPAAPQFSDLQTMVPEYGYWIKSTEDSVLPIVA